MSTNHSGVSLSIEIEGGWKGSAPIQQAKNNKKDDKEVIENIQIQTMNEENDSVTTTNNADPELLTRKPADTAIRQQRIKAWHPILDPLWVIITFLIMGGVFVPVGRFPLLLSFRSVLCFPMMLLYINL